MMNRVALGHPDHDSCGTGFITRLGKLATHEVIDRNGLRPLRYQRTSDGWLVAGSEAGIADFSRREIVERQRLGPGEMLMVELASGQVYRNGELLRSIAGQKIRGPRSAVLPLRPATAETTRTVAHPKQLAAAVGWSEDQLRLLLQPLAEGGEPIWSMGDDTPPAFMSKFRRTLWDYCKQRFAQVTNPAIDPLRESHVMSLRTRIGPEFISDSPVFSGSQLLFLRGCFAPCRVTDVTFPVVEGIRGAREALERIRSEVRSQKLIVLSDRGTNQERAALPILLAASAVWRTMVEADKFNVPLVVEIAQVVDTHHVALLISVGATGVCPFLAMQLAEETCLKGAENLNKGINAGLRKVLSRMGISTLASYRNSQLFETVGLDRALCEEFFESATSVAEEKSLDEILDDYLQNHQAAFTAESVPLKDLGLYRFRKGGERHGTSPELMRKMQAHVKAHSLASYQEIEDLGQKREPLAIRDMLELLPTEPVDLDTVESEAAILRRFSTQAMSLGAISPEAHRTLAQAMNSLGARSNTGEGGEDPDLYAMDPQSCNKIKQVASARFGVTTEYLVHAQEIEIKIAQGSKPGEGGQLPATKVSPYIARLRHAVPGMALISPPPHHDIYSIEDLGQLIHDLREVNPKARIGVKLVAGAGVGIIAAGVAKAGADVITISGHDGGTGASPLSSIKNTGLPWEFGLRDAHRTLTQCGLRGRVRLRVDGGLKFARDILVAALLGADEFGFGTAALLAMGCVMARQCHLNTCPVGIATQDETLRMRFTGKPEMVIAYFRGVASEVRAWLSRAGARSIDEIVGHAEYLKASGADQPWVRELLDPIPAVEQTPRPARHRNALAKEILHTAKTNRFGTFRITNQDRSIGAGLSGEMFRCLTKNKSADLMLEGVAGQSFGAFLVPGISLHLLGEANDYVGKGLSGGVIAISAGAKASLRGDVVAGNTVLYGATSGELYMAGAAGERFAVRNSGAFAVVEGVGDHGCEYMTGGVAVILGPAGINLGSGMTGGLLYMLTNQFADSICNLNFVQAAACTGDEESHLRLALARHLELTGSPRAEALLDSYRGLSFTRVQPVQLPCPVSQTWAPILERLKRFGESETIRSRVFESPVLASLTMRSNQPRNRPQRLREY